MEGVWREKRNNGSEIRRKSGQGKAENINGTEEGVGNRGTWDGVGM